MVWTAEQWDSVLRHAAAIHRSNGKRLTLQEAQVALPVAERNTKISKREEQRFSRLLDNEIVEDAFEHRHDEPEILTAPPAAQEPVVPTVSLELGRSVLDQLAQHQPFIHALAMAIARCLNEGRTVQEPELVPEPAVDVTVFEKPDLPKPKLTIAVIGMLNNLNWKLEKEFEGKAKFVMCTNEATHDTLRAVAKNSDVVIANVGFLSHSKEDVIRKSLSPRTVYFRASGGYSQISAIVREVTTEE